MNSITISNTAIRRDAEGRYSLNDLHKAAMAVGAAVASQKPSEFLRAKGATSFIEALETKAGISALDVTKGGSAPGTYADELVALRYAAWINPAFEVEVYRTFRDARTGEPAPATAPAPLNGQIALLECAARLLNVSESGKIVMLQKLGQSNGLDTGFLPSYAIDAPSDAADANSEPTKPVTELLKAHGCKFGPVAFNRLLLKRGLLRKMTCKNSKGEAAHFWSVTEAGLPYGKNITSPQSPRETQPHWYVSRFESLLKEVLQ